MPYREGKVRRMYDSPRPARLLSIVSTRGRTWRVVVCAAALLASMGFAHADGTRSWLDEYQEVAKATATACKNEVLALCRTGLQRLADLTDGRPDFRCRLARVDAQLGAAQTALEDLSLCVRAGLVFKDLATDHALDAVRALPGYASVEREARRQALPVSNFDPHLSLKDPNLIAEDITYDARAHTFYVSSVHERKIVRIGADGVAEDFITTAQLRMWGVFALAVDPARGVLWATTSAGAESPPFAPTDEGKSTILKFDLRSRTLLGHYEIDDGRHHGFGDVTLAGDGTLFVSDGIDGGVYRIAADARDGLQTVVAPGSLRSPQTPALIPGTCKVLIPDYTRGIAIADVATRTVTWLGHPPELALLGIDGLYLDGRTLIAIQNGTVPERVLVMTLDPTCTRITHWRAAVVNVPTLGDPTHGTFVGRDFYFLANSGWDRVKDDGSFTEDATASAPQIWKLRTAGDTRSAPQTCPRAMR